METKAAKKPWNDAPWKPTPNIDPNLLKNKTAELERVSVIVELCNAVAAKAFASGAYEVPGIKWTSSGKLVFGQMNALEIKKLLEMPGIEQISQSRTLRCF